MHQNLAYTPGKEKNGKANISLDTIADHYLCSPDVLIHRAKEAIVLS